MSQQLDKALVAWTPPDRRLPGKYSGYRLVKPLGRGVKSIVWKAHSDYHNQFDHVAVKFIFPDESIAALVRNLNRELELYKRFDDEYICKPWSTLQLEETSGWAPRALVMPYFDTSLRNFLKLFKVGVLTPDATPADLILKWVVDISLALDYLHFFKPLLDPSPQSQRAWEHEEHLGFAHRDLKPENILLRLPRQRSSSLYSIANFLQARIRLADLELCSAIGENPILTRDDGYKDKEMLEAARAGEYTASPAEDIFAMGLIINELAKCTTKGRALLEELGDACVEQRIGAADIVLRVQDIRKQLPWENPMLDNRIEVRVKEHHASRRTFLQQTGAAFGALIVPTVIDKAARNFHHYFLPQGFAPKSVELPFPWSSNFIDRFLVGTRCGLAAGASNQLKIREGKGHGASGYVNQTFNLFHSVVEQCFKLTAEHRSYRHPLIQFDFQTVANLIMIGGPVANPYVRETNEYDELRNETGQILPVFRQRGCLPFGFFCGHDDYGIWDDGKLHLVRRFENGKEVERHVNGTKEQGRPLYSIIHRDRGILFGPGDLIDKQGFLRKDFLLITVRPHPNHPRQRMISFAGMHGYCLEAFARDTYKSFSRLDQFTRDLEAFQLLIPARVVHQEGTSYADLLWDEIEKRDCLIVPNRPEDWRIRLDASE